MIGKISAPGRYRANTFRQIEDTFTENLTKKRECHDLQAFH